MAASAEPPTSNVLRSPADAASLASDWPFEVTREWAFGDSTGAGVRVCVLDSGVDADHPLVGGLERSVTVVADEEDGVRVEDDDEGDVFGHGTACAGIIRALAPECAISSVRVLGPTNRGRAKIMLGGLRWALDQGYDVINLSLSSTKRELAGLFHELADCAYFNRRAIVASAHNLALESYPWRFSSVISVGSHQLEDPLAFFYNSTPPVEFYARGFDIEVAWAEGRTMRSSGNSFATAHVSGICALILAEHPRADPV